MDFKGPYEPWYLKLVDGINLILKTLCGELSYPGYR